AGVPVQATAPSPSTRPTHAATTSTDPTGYEVQPGDTLWDIAAAHLPERASAADIAAAWPEWYRANQAAIGADADLIFPGTTLHPPDMGATASTSKGAT
ncbi:MAG TPA: LysM domain-containing protein, partial [Ruania sp.]|nr:LysM domain-containing protein [Ruania sp.]